MPARTTEGAAVAASSEPFLAFVVRFFFSLGAVSLFLDSLALVPFLSLDAFSFLSFFSFVAFGFCFEASVVSLAAVEVSDVTHEGPHPLDVVFVSRNPRFAGGTQFPGALPASSGTDTAFVGCFSMHSSQGSQVSIALDLFE